MDISGHFVRLLLWCKLVRVRRFLPAQRLSKSAVLLVLLALQWVFGLQLQAVQAVASPMPMATHTMAHHAHATALDAAVVQQSDQASQPDCPKHSMPHDCCHANACQCQCAYTPGAMTLPALANIATSVAVPSLDATQFVAPRIDEFLRPPIA